MSIFVCNVAKRMDEKSYRCLHISAWLNFSPVGFDCLTFLVIFLMSQTLIFQIFSFCDDSVESFS